jgi:hypothetical protein
MEHGAFVTCDVMHADIDGIHVLRECYSDDLRLQHSNSTMIHVNVTHSSLCVVANLKPCVCSCSCWGDQHLSFSRIFLAGPATVFL